MKRVLSFIFSACTHFTMFHATCRCGWRNIIFNGSRNEAFFLCSFYFIVFSIIFFFTCVYTRTIIRIASYTERPFSFRIHLIIRSITGKQKNVHSSKQKRRNVNEWNGINEKYLERKKEKRKVEMKLLWSFYTFGRKIIISLHIIERK